MDRGGPETAELGGPLRVSSETLGAPKALFMTVWRPSTRSAENSCGMRQRLTVPAPGWPCWPPLVDPPLHRYSPSHNPPYVT